MAITDHSITVDRLRNSPALRPGSPVFGVANGLGDAKTDADADADADLGSHDLQATWTPGDGDPVDDKLTSNTVSVVVAGAATQGDVGSRR